MTPDDARDRPLVAILDDDEGFLASVAMILEGECILRAFSRRGDLEAAIEEEEPDVLFLDLNLGEGAHAEDGFGLYERLRERGFDFPVIVLTQLAGLDVTVRAYQLGLPFLQKSDELVGEQFRQHIAQAVRLGAHRRELEYRRRETGRTRRIETCPWPESGPGATVRRLLHALLATREPLLLEGEPGTGKRTTARWIHDHAPGQSGPFVEIDAALLAEDALERELFGEIREDGTVRVGALDAATLGTLYVEGLDRGPEASVRRLDQAIRARYFTPVRGRRRRRVRCRVILSRVTTPAADTAWSEDLELHWKPNRILLPPVRTMREALEFHLDFLRSQLERDGARHLVEFGDEDLSALRLRRLAGNFVDLKVALLHGIEALEEDDRGSRERTIDMGRLARWPVRKVLYHVERQYLQAVVEDLGRDAEAIARHAGYSRATAYRRLGEMDLPD